MDACDRCLAPLPDGVLRFQARLRLTGELGGLPDPAATAGGDALSQALHSAEQLDESQLMETVLEEFTFTLCAACRGRLRADPAGASSVAPPRRGVAQ